MSGDMAYFLDEQAAELERRGQQLLREIERTEKELVELRDERDKAFRRKAEAITAANILREVGLRSSTVKGVPLIEVDYQATRPEASGMTQPEAHPEHRRRTL